MHVHPPSLAFCLFTINHYRYEPITDEHKRALWEDFLNDGFAIVVDIGKTLSKVSLWSRSGRMLDKQVRPNKAIQSNGVRSLDVIGIAEWLVPALARYSNHPVEAIVPVAHGAAVVALQESGLCFAPLDYEQPLPRDIAEIYQAERDSFAETGSPSLPEGLNMGAQLFWLERMFPDTMRRATLVPWAQYWAWFLSGKAASEVTSLGCHTDLWSPLAHEFSPMAKRFGWAERFAPLARAADPVGELRADLGRTTGLANSVRVLTGLHDSNAALLAARGFDEISNGDATILSTGTWFVAMRVPTDTHAAKSLPPSRDCLLNVDIYGAPVPSARFMGGREIESVIEIDTRRIDIKPDQPALLSAVPGVLSAGAMLLPTLAPGSGPFPDQVARWQNCPDGWYARRAAMSLYAALVADHSLDLIGSRDRLLVEGRFAEADVFVRALASLRPDTEVLTANAHNDVSFGAMRLLDPMLQPQGDLIRVEPLDANLDTYRSRWLAEIGRAA